MTSKIVWTAIFLLMLIGCVGFNIYMIPQVGAPVAVILGVIGGGMVGMSFMLFWLS